MDLQVMEGTPNEDFWGDNAFEVYELFLHTKIIYLHYMIILISN